MTVAIWVIFGGAGYIGKHLTKELRKGNEESNVFLAPSLAISGETWFEGQLRFNPRWQEAKEIRVVILSAAGVLGPLSQEGFDFNATAVPMAALRMSLEPRARVFVAGSSFEYGTSGNRIESLDPVTTPLMPSEDYGKSKSLGFGKLLTAFESRGNLSYGRIFQVWGGLEPQSRLLPTLLENAKIGKSTILNSGDAVRDFISVSATAQQIVQHFQTDWLSRKVFNICFGYGTSVEDFCRNALIENGFDPDLVESGPKIDHPYRRLVGSPVTNWGEPS